MLIFVHNKSFRPRELEEAFFIKPGEWSTIGIKRTFVKNEPEPYTDCKDLTSYSSELYDLIITSNKKYRQKDCFDLCIQQLVINQCGRYFLQYVNLNSNQTKPCLTQNETNCADNARIQVDTVKCASEYCPLSEYCTDSQNVNRFNMI